jgi:integrase
MYFGVGTGFAHYDNGFMQSHSVSNRPKSKWKSRWFKVSKRVSGLYQYRPTGMYYARVRHRDKIYRESLQTKDLAFAKRRLADFKRRLDRTEPRYGRISFAAWLQDVYFPTLRGSSGALKAKQRIITRIKTKWVFARTQPMRDLRESHVLTFLTDQYGEWSHSYWNSALSLIRDALEMAVRDHALIENPAARLKYRKRKTPIRLTPTFDQFKAIVADIRAQPFNRDADDSGDFVEFLGQAGMGQAEAAAIKREHADLEAGRILVFRHKTMTAFMIPIYPQLRPLLEKLCAGRKHNEHLFPITQARKALTNACKRLGFPHFTHRSLRRMFITRAIERGVDIKVIAQWQGHKDQGQLILQTYSHVRPEHSNRMALLMSDAEPENVVPMRQRGGP